MLWWEWGGHRWASAQIVETSVEGYMVPSWLDPADQPRSRTSRYPVTGANTLTHTVICTLWRYVLLELSCMKHWEFDLDSVSCTLSHSDEWMGWDPTAPCCSPSKAHSRVLAPTRTWIPGTSARTGTNTEMSEKELRLRKETGCRNRQEGSASVRHQEGASRAQDPSQEGSESQPPQAGGHSPELKAKAELQEVAVWGCPPQQEPDAGRTWGHSLLKLRDHI